jgi:hypothetical protein
MKTKSIEKKKKAQTNVRTMRRNFLAAGDNNCTNQCDKFNG